MSPQSRIKGGVPRVTPMRPSGGTGDAAELEAFVEGAPGKGTLPFQLPHVRDDLMVQLNTRIPERLDLQLEWLAHHLSGRGEGVTSKQDLVTRALREMVHRELHRLGIRP